MVTIAKGLESVVVRVALGPRTSVDEYATRSESPDDRSRSYVAHIYGRADLPVRSTAGPLPGQPKTRAGESLVGVVPFTIRWGHYNDYLAAYVEGDKAAWHMRERLFEALPAGLAAVVAGDFDTALPCRTWFSGETPELEELPWELVAFRSSRRADTGGSFVRGLPPDAPTPLVPLGGPLRVALIDPLGQAPAELVAALSDAAIDVHRASGSVREGLRQAASDGLELAHVVADGSVTLSYEGVLEFPGTDEAPLAPGEVASILRGSRIRLLGLTAIGGPDPARTRIGDTVVPSVYRAFTHFATSAHVLPSVIAPMGPLAPHQLAAFWGRFYADFSESLELEAAISRAQRPEPLAIALFLRQLQAPTFRRVGSPDEVADPSAANADLEASRELVDQLTSLSSKFGVSNRSIDAFVKKESVRQGKLEAEVSDWVEGVDES